MNAEVDHKPWLEAAAAAIAAAPGVQDAVVQIRDIYGLDHVTYHHAHILGRSMDIPYVRSTYSAEWLARYLLRGYIRVDPVVQEGFSRQLPFDWRQLTLTMASRALMIDAAAHGLAGNGYSIPLIDKQSRRAIFSITSSMPVETWDAFRLANAADLAEIAYQIHATAIREIYDQQEPIPQLSPREIECLTWAAQGKEARDIATILGIARNTIEKYLQTTRFKLGSASTTQAVAKAIRLGLINP